MTQPLPTNWFNLGAIILDEDGTPLPRRPFIKLIGGWTIADDPTNLATDLTPPGADGLPDNVVSVVGIPLGTTVTATLYAVHEVDLTSGPVEIDMPASMNTTGQKLWVKILAGDPSVHNLTLKAPPGLKLEGIVGTARAPGDYTSQTLVFNRSGQLGQENKYRLNGVGNVSSQ